MFKSFFDYFMSDVCLFWLLSLILDFVLVLKEGQFWWKLNGPVLNIHRLMHCLIGVCFIVGGFFILYFYQKPIVIGILCCSSCLCYAVLTHFVAINKTIYSRKIVEISNLIILVGTCIVSLQTTILMGYVPFIGLCIILMLLSTVFFVLNIIKSNKLFFILEKLFCYLLLSFFLLWFLL